LNQIRTLIFVLFISVPCIIIGQDIPTLIREAQQYESALNEDAAFKKYQEVLKYQPINVMALCKCSELCSRIGARQPKKETKVDYFKAGRRYAELALKLNPSSSEANFVMAVAMGRMALISNGRDKIEAVNEIKKYAENAIRLDPQDFKGYHVLGKWHYEVSNLSGVERTAAKLFFGGLPKASLKESIWYYEKSKALFPELNLNYLELAKAYHRNNENKKAIELLKKLETMSFKTADDARVKKEGQKLLKEWN
jgi:tetratricopeptide (TPR) repeat protein